MKETKGAVTMHGSPLTLLGTPVKVGQKAPNFKLQAAGGREVQLSDTRGKVRLVSVVYSVDTSVCDLQTQRFEQEAHNFGDVVFYSVSMDLPAALSRYTKNHENKNVQMLSDHLDTSFGTAYGLLIKGQRMLSRAIFIIDADDTVRYAEYVKEVGQLPDLDGALSALKTVVSHPTGVAA